MPQPGLSECERRTPEPDPGQGRSGRIRREFAQNRKTAEAGQAGVLLLVRSDKSLIPCKTIRSKTRYPPQLGKTAVPGCRSSQSPPRRPSVPLQATLFHVSLLLTCKAGLSALTRFRIRDCFACSSMFYAWFPTDLCIHLFVYLCVCSFVYCHSP